MDAKALMAVPLLLILNSGDAEAAKDILQQVIAADCTPSPDASAEEMASLERFKMEMSKASVLRYIAGEDSIFDDYYTALEQRKFLAGLEYSDKLKRVRGLVITPEQKDYIRAARKAIESAQDDNIRSYFSEKYPHRSYAVALSFCEFKKLGKGVSTPAFEYASGIVKASKIASREVSIGYFSVKINSCAVTDGPVTGNSYTEPKNWPGSRFVVIDASFKNIDQEGRLPSEGSLIIKHNGRELKYDSTETIMQEGYGIYFKSVNPLITMPTKIVYRIPNEVSGEVSWEPGRNLDGKRLWCTFATPEK